MNRIILASNSPRRRELLEQVGVEFDVLPAESPEVITKSEPDEIVLELSERKAKEVATGIITYNELHPDITTPTDILVIGADTVVAFDGKVMGKPGDEEDAKGTLKLLQGNTHSVYTGVSLIFITMGGEKGVKAGMHSFYEKTDVEMFPMSDEEIERYVATGEPMDKAGSYAIQGKCAIYIKKIDGDYNNVVGLPVARLYRELKAIGIDLLDSGTC